VRLRELTLPIGLQYLKCSGCFEIKELELPDDLIELDCSNCIKLEKIINISARLSHVYIKNCRLLTTLEGHHIFLLNIDYSSTPWLNNEINLWYNGNIKRLKMIQKVIHNAWYRRYLIKRYYLKKLIPTALAKYILKF
jgi:hypothetical protein